VGRRKSTLEMLTKVHWSFGVCTGIGLFLLVRFGGVWFISRLLEGIAISPTGSMPPTVPRSTIESLTMIGLAAMLACWLMALLSFIAQRRRDKRRALGSK
jgi:hypothetical protein